MKSDGIGWGGMESHRSFEMGGNPTGALGHNNHNILCCCHFSVVSFTPVSSQPHKNCSLICLKTWQWHCLTSRGHPSVLRCWERIRAPFFYPAPPELLQICWPNIGRKHFLLSKQMQSLHSVGTSLLMEFPDQQSASVRRWCKQTSAFRVSRLAMETMA